MLLNRRFDYATLARVTHPDGARFYTCPATGAPLPSVTTILSATSDKAQALKEWAERVGEVKAQRARDEGLNLGTLVHTHVENFIDGQPRPGGNNLIRQQAARMADQIIERGLARVHEVWGMEISMYSPGLYAGTTDLVGLYDGRPAIMDHKTAKKIRSRDMIEDYFAQLAAYALAHDEIYGTEIEMGVIFMVARDLKFVEYVVEGQEFRDHKKKFVDRLGAYLASARAPALACA